MATAACFLGALVTLLCSILLVRRYVIVRLQLLFWSGVCFAALSVSNSLLFGGALAGDRGMVQLGLAIAAVGMGILMCALILEGKRS